MIGPIAYEGSSVSADSDNPDNIAFMKRFAPYDENGYSKRNKTLFA
jgi:hypothetical protein